MKAVNSRIIQQLFVHLLSKICVPAISSDTVTCYLYIEKKDINLLFITFFPQFNFLLFFARGLCANLISTGIDKCFVLYFTTVKSTNVLNNRHQAICSTNRNGS